jgi:hypothetical protein
MWFIAVMLAIPGGSPPDQPGSSNEETTMNHPQETDPCVFIRKDIEITQKLIDDGRFELQHPEISPTTS